MNTRSSGYPGMTRRHLTLIISQTLILVMAGCSFTSPESNSLDPRMIRPSESSGPWQVSGKLAIKAESSSFAANFIWHRHSTDKETVKLSGPLSLNKVVIERHGEKLLWLDGETRLPFETLSADLEWPELFSRLPIVNLGNCLLGFPPSGSAWTLSVSNWQQIQGLVVPAKVTIEGFGYQIRIILSEWVFQNTT